MYGNNSLWYSVVQPKKNYDLIELLVKNGSNPLNRNNAGRTPVDFAKQISDERVIRLLTKEQE
jgi:ankyrin repeat protein